MITEKDRILALALIAAQGPTPEQIRLGRWTKSQMAFGSDVLRGLVQHVRAGLHYELPESLVKRTLAGDLFMPEEDA